MLLCFPVTIVSVVENESTLEDFTEYCSANEGHFRIIVGKRTERSIFSNVLSEEETQKQLKLIEDNDISIVNCVRDGRFVVDSWLRAWGVFNPFVWMVSIMEAEKHMSYIKSTVYYEHLVESPAFVQQLMEILVNEKAKESFKDYPKFVPEHCFPSEDDRYKPRPLEVDNRVPPLSYTDKPNDVETFKELLIELGYEQPIRES